MPRYKLQREYTNWEEVIVEADSKEQAQEMAYDEDTWEYSYDVDSYNMTGEIWVKEDS